MLAIGDLPPPWRVPQQPRQDHVARVSLPQEWEQLAVEEEERRAARKAVAQARQQLAVEREQRRADRKAVAEAPQQLQQRPATHDLGPGGSADSRPSAIKRARQRDGGFLEGWRQTAWTRGGGHASFERSKEPAALKGR